MWNKPVIFIEDVVWAYVTAEEMYENGVVTEVEAVFDIVLQPQDGSIAQSYFAQCRTDVLKHSYTVSELILDQC